MKFLRPEMRGDDGRASFYASSSSPATPYPPDAGFNRYDIAALGSSSHHDQVQHSSYHADSTYLGHHSVGTAGTSYREDHELEIRRRRLREIADVIELAHIRTLEEHDRRLLSIAEKNPYARAIPFYPDLSDERCNVQREEIWDGARSHYLPAQDICLDERQPVNDPYMQNRFSRCNVMLPPRFMHEAPPPLVVPVPVPVPITKKKVKSSADDTDKKLKKKYGHEVIEIKPIKSEELREISGLLHANKKCKLVLSPGEMKSNDLHKGEFVASPENNAAIVSCSDKKESGSFSINRKRKLDSPPTTLEQKHDNDKPINEELTSLPKKEVKPAHVPQSDNKLKEEEAFGDKGNLSSSKRTVIMTGHNMAKQPPPNFAKTKNKNEKNRTLGHNNIINKPIIIMQDGKWYCNLCDVKCLSDKNKEEHMRGKRHRESLQAQAMAQRIANKDNKQHKPAPKLHFCATCNITCTSRVGLFEHFNGKKHRNLVMINQTPAV